ncbi:hypothetical protein DA391_18350 [Yersinia massiliensis]|uniref:Uncharacterized protein n=1 Tax=Yersinia massiliensis TaxID=419257 RepID=A0ABM6UZZ4_9GAMM|nr:hypothetical protein DA391_18350 [Yersinia massiliensis]
MGESVPLTPLRRQGHRVYPKPLAFQQGSKRTSPNELTPVSDLGESVPLTPLRRQGRRVN